MQPRDAGLEVEFLRGLSKDALYKRVFSHRGMLPGELERLTRIDFDREMALLATTRVDSAERLVAVARYVKDAEGAECEFAIVIADDWQRRGLGRKLLGSLVTIAAAVGMRRMHGYTFSTNEAMKGLSRALGFSAQADPRDNAATILSRVLEKPGSVLVRPAGGCSGP